LRCGGGRLGGGARLRGISADGGLRGSHLGATGGGLRYKRLRAVGDGLRGSHLGSARRGRLRALRELSRLRDLRAWEALRGLGIALATLRGLGGLRSRYALGGSLLRGLDSLGGSLLRGLDGLGDRDRPGRGVALRATAGSGRRHVIRLGGTGHDLALRLALGLGLALGLALGLGLVLRALLGRSGRSGRSGRGRRLRRLVGHGSTRGLCVRARLRRELGVLGLLRGRRLGRGDGL
ncbi:hypothetical protein, partial [Streptomyces sp. SID8499]|uniref:hypothetical protein n=1 Tax=Streptomyces sp. SID8499 TaxID=2706106 RepID=UPI0013CD377B